MFRKQIDTMPAGETAPDGFAIPPSPRLLDAMAGAAAIMQLRRDYRAQIERAEADHAACQRGVEEVRLDIASGALDIHGNQSEMLAARKAKQEVCAIRLDALRERLEASIPVLSEVSEELTQARRSWAAAAAEEFRPVYQAAVRAFEAVCFQGIALGAAIDDADGLLANAIRRNRAEWPGAEGNLLRWFENRFETSPDAPATLIVEEMWRRDAVAVDVFERHSAAVELARAVTSELRTASAAAAKEIG